MVLVDPFGQRDGCDGELRARVPFYGSASLDDDAADLGGELTPPWGEDRHQRLLVVIGSDRQVAHRSFQGRREVGREIVPGERLRAADVELPTCQVGSVQGGDRVAGRFRGTDPRHRERCRQRKRHDPVVDDRWSDPGPSSISR